MLKPEDVITNFGSIPPMSAVTKLFLKKLIDNWCSLLLLIPKDSPDYMEAYAHYVKTFIRESGWSKEQQEIVRDLFTIPINNLLREIKHRESKDFVPSLTPVATREGIDMLKTLEALYLDINELPTSDMTTAERSTHAKTRVQTLEKITELQREQYLLLEKRSAAAIVLDIFNTILTDEQRQQAQDKLAHLLQLAQ